jgi:acyl carrier protein
VTVNTSEEAIAAWCQEYLADVLEVPATAIDPGVTFDRVGVDSVIAVSLLLNVEERYGVELPAQVLFDNRTLNALATYVATHALPDAA